MYLSSPHETGPLAGHISIDHYVAALGDPNMRMFVMSRDPAMLEDALNYTIRYEALLLGATEQTQPAVLDPASYVCDYKGRKKENIRAVEVHQDTKQRDLERSLEAQKALNDENQRKLAKEQRQMDTWRTWNDEQTPLQNRQPQSDQYDWRQSSQANSGGQQGDTRQYASSYRENQVADAVPTPQDTQMATLTTCKVRTSATTVEGRDTSLDFANSHNDPVGQKYISNPHRRRPPIRPASS